MQCKHSPLEHGPMVFGDIIKDPEDRTLLKNPSVTIRKHVHLQGVVKTHAQWLHGPSMRYTVIVRKNILQTAPTA